MKTKINNLKEKLNEVKTITNKDYKLTVVLCVLLGITIGYFIAPLKKGVFCGNNNGNTTNNYFGKEGDCE
ncbi:MAG TPA: hypothetical protein VJZ04_03005 [Lachnospiraceae bacterium]|nr:hypothetical protein [Lachnospiraceae bacterium]